MPYMQGNRWLWVCILLLIGHAAYAENFEARLTDFDTPLTIIAGADGKELVPEKDMSLVNGDTLITGSKASAEVVLNGKAVFVLEENSIFIIGNTDRDTSWVELNSGVLILKIGELLGAHERLEVRTETSIAGIRGTEVAIEADKHAATTRIGLFEGVLEVGTRSDQDRAFPAVVLQAGQQTRVDRLKAPTPPEPLKKRMLRHGKRIVKLRARLKTVNKEWTKRRKSTSRRLRKKIRKKIRRRNRRPIKRR